MGEVLRFQAEIVLIFFLFVGFAIAAVVWHFHAQRKRREAFAFHAARLGLQFEPASTEGLQRFYRHLSPFSEGRGGRPRCRNVLRGRFRDLEVRLFDYIFTVSTGKSSHDVWFGVALAFVPEHWPSLSIVPEHVGHKIIDALGADDIDFESEEFSRRFWVRSPDRKFAYDVVHPRMMEFLMGPGWDRWHLTGNLICLWTKARLKPDEIPATLDRLAQFHALVPDHVKNRSRPTPATAAGRVA